MTLAPGALAVGPTQSCVLWYPLLGEWLYTRLRRDPQAAYQTLAPYYGRLDELPKADRAFLFQRVNERVWSDGQRRAFFSTFHSLARWLPGQQRDLAVRLSTHLAVVPGAGHNVHQENAEAVLKAIREWMACS